MWAEGAPWRTGQRRTAEPAPGTAAPGGVRLRALLDGSSAAPFPQKRALHREFIAHSWSHEGDGVQVAASSLSL